MKLKIMSLKSINCLAAAIICLTALIHQCNGAEKKSYNETCTMDEECTEPFVCVNKIRCECKDKYTVSEDKKKCLAAIGEHCKEKYDCIQPDSHCVSNKCVCEPDKVEEDGRCYQNITHINHECKVNTQCVILLGASGTCKNNECSCKDGYRLDSFYMSCNAKEGTTCSKKEDCRSDYVNLECDNKKCVCPQSYTYTEEGCRTTGLVYNNSCRDAAECSGFAHSMCDGNTERCDCEDGFVYENGYCYVRLGQSCNEDLLCSPTSQHICDENKHVCVCDKGLEYIDSKCIKTNIGLNEKCNQDRECKGHPRTKCISGVCDCDTDHTKVGDKCLVNLNGECEQPEDCYGENVECSRINGCQCKYGFDVIDGKCSQFKSLNGKCNQDRECKGHPHTKCISGVCNCDTDHTKVGDKCLVNLNGKCQQTEECYGENVECSLIDGCSCKNGFDMIDGKCLQIKTVNFNEKCFYDEECEQNKDIICFKLKDEIKGTCLCKEGYVFANTRCLLKKKFNENCVSNAQCSSDAVKFECLNNTCQCSSGHKYADGICKIANKKYNETCNKNIMCDQQLYLDCRDGFCQCKTKYVFEKSNNTCVSLGYKLTAASGIYLFISALFINKLYADYL